MLRRSEEVKDEEHNIINGLIKMLDTSSRDGDGEDHIITRGDEDPINSVCSINLINEPLLAKNFQTTATAYRTGRMRIYSAWVSTMAVGSMPHIVIDIT